MEKKGVIPLIRELVSEEEIRSAYPVMSWLRTHLREDDYMNLVREARETDGYRMMVLENEGRIAAVAGFKPMITLYYGRFVWVCDLVTDPAVRSKGYGAELLKAVHDWARSNGYERVALSSGLHRADAHRFYEEKMGYERASYVFKYDL
ncbi:GNAT family N-acetyltransferase [Alteribacter natronophilus]|uniref:GNAT family N-acetyltransferase n=1 Tax=Alteribacter natronophilus TaxID=2583810 RepID=UPI00110E79E6|nr:GNAT family N-acetyltransferase [Alteribacter natronophilus]TMW72813.1 GNAT family N-acetyltransferase [Alteribacter natronophilus]